MGHRRLGWAMFQLTRYWCIFGSGWLTEGLECMWDSDPRCWRHQHLPIIPKAVFLVLSAIGYVFGAVAVAYVLLYVWP